MKVLLTTFGVAVASALFPLINIEAYIAGVAALGDSIGVWQLSCVAAAGQAVGKVFWYEIGRSSMNWSYIRKKMESPRWQAQYTKWTERIDSRPWVGMALLFFSATLGFPHWRSWPSWPGSCASTVSGSTSPPSSAGRYVSPPSWVGWVCSREAACSTDPRGHKRPVERPHMHPRKGGDCPANVQSVPCGDFSPCRR